MKLAVSLAIAAAVAAGPVAAAPKAAKPAAKPAAKAAPVAAPTINAADWRQVDPENVLVIDTTKGRIFVELSPQAAPDHVTRVKQLTREHFYDGLKFHRVIDDFMAQTGDPQGTGEGQSSYPNVKGEFTFRRDSSLAYTPVATPTGAVVGFLGALPIQTQPDDAMAFTKDNKVWAWGLFCPGVAGMARGEDENSANSQFFLMRQTYPSLDKRYTAWGRVVSGLQVVRSLQVGEPPANPDLMTKVQVLADIPEGQRPHVMVLDTNSKVFGALVDKARAAKGADFSICDVDLPSQVR